ncbi:MAG: AAA-like domain-containing protein [Tannerellaceae bacterium]
MAKILRKYTTIPSHLYVKRYADKQIKQIIEEMDRPGYVLVARQMGKTNLLFNTKRELEDINTVISYIDLSNVFDNERECYRNIIDTIIDSKDDIFDVVAKEIEENRRNNERPPHKEYSQELRKLLKAHDGKIVIILDEIDALRSVPYSDKIFAQIRSNYFARTNYPEFEKLTYILSGVIEPTELIKDRNKSPFNIGEKIYLDDFTFEEHLEFVTKSKLNISDEITKEIYNWTNGNPRLTFDICSEIEDYLINNNDINTKTVEDIISKRYLTTFDIAPIDHIRELVATNATIRKAIVNIRSNSNEISSEIKSKLYLFGIINSDFNNLSIKNKIIDLSLSDEWLKSVERQTKSLFEIGSEAITKDIDIDKGIEYLKEYLNSDLNIPNAERQLSNYYIGYGYHSQHKFKESNEYLLNLIISCDISTDLHYRQKLFIGLNFLALKEFVKAEEYLNEIIENYKNTQPYLNALLNLARGLLEKGFENNKERAKKLLFDIVNCADQIEVDNSDRLTLKEFRTLSYYYLAEISFIEKNIDEAIKLINAAYSIADIQYIPELLYLKYTMQHYKENELLNEIYNTISSNNLKFSKQSFDISFTEVNLYKYLVTCFDNERVIFENLFNHTLNTIFSSKKKAYHLYFNMAISSNKISTAISLFEKVLEFKDDIEDTKLVIETYKNLAELNITQHHLFIRYFNEYVNLFIKNKVIPEVSDITTFVMGIKFYSDKKDLNKGLSLCDTISLSLKNLNGELEYEELIISYWYCNLYYSLKQNKKAIEYANNTINIINKYKEKQKTRSFIDEKGITTISSQMEQIKKSISSRVPVNVDRKYGRNDIVKVKYIDGAEVRNKFKKLEADIMAERCIIIE